MIEIISRVVPDFVSLDFCGSSCFLVGLGDDTDILLIYPITHEIIFVGIPLDTSTKSRISIHRVGELVV